VDEGAKSKTEAMQIDNPTNKISTTNISSIF